MSDTTMDRLQLLRSLYGSPLVITSGYRSPRHTIEAAKETPGTHSLGRAVDIACNGAEALDLIGEALEVEFTGFGVQQKGENRFLHLDDLRDGEHTAPRPTIWSY